jgi:hypothetical protein
MNKYKYNYKYKYIVVPRDEHSNEVIASLLLQTAALDGSEVTFNFKEFEKRGYYVKHQFVTNLNNSINKNLRYFLYSQEGNGAIRKYSIPKKKVSSHMKQLKKRLKEIASSR